MARVRLSAIEKFYGPLHAVRGIDLDIPEGEFTVIVGPSGCGKSTLLRTIAGLEDADAGTIEIDGEVVNDMRPRDRNVAMVFQNYALYPYMNVFDNIAFGLRARHVPATETKRRVLEAAAMLGISDQLARLPRELSGGQRQRVAIGRAIVRDARLFLFDEPLSNLDAKLREEMRSEIKRLHQELGKTMIYVTHDQIEAMTLADRIVLLRNGLIEQEGAPLDLFELPATKFVAGFLGSPSMTFLDARLGDGGGDDASGLAVVFEDGTRLALPAERAQTLGEWRDKRITLGLRTEHFSRAAEGAPRRDGLADLAVTIELVQPTGSRTYASFRISGQSAMAELQAHEVERPGERLALWVDMNRVVIIDPASERVL